METLTPPITNFDVCVHDLWGHPVMVWDTKDFELCRRLEAEALDYRRPDGARFSLWNQDPERFPATRELKRLFFQGIDYWLLGAGYRAGDGSPVLGFSWVERYREAAYIQPHSHGSHLSVLFFSRDLTPEPLSHMTANEGAPINGATYIIDPAAVQQCRFYGNPTTRQIFSKPGRMLIFPSSLSHGTHPVFAGEFKRTFVSDVYFRALPIHTRNTANVHESIDSVRPHFERDAVAETQAGNPT